MEGLEFHGVGRGRAKKASKVVTTPQTHHRTVSVFQGVGFRVSGLTETWTDQSGQIRRMTT